MMSPKTSHVATAAVVLLAAAVAYLNQSSSRAGVQFDTPDGLPRAPEPSPLTDAQVEQFHRDGFLLKRGLLSGPRLESTMNAAERVYRQPSLLDLVFRYSFAKLSMQVWRFRPDFAKVAFESSMPSISAQLLGEDQKTDGDGDGGSGRGIRILKDALFGQTNTGVGCGFHVDDKGFWPARDDSTGVNFWVALSPMRVSEGGGIRVANGTHTAAWAKECRAVIADNFSKTCMMAELSPRCDGMLQNASRVFDMEPGDALLWDRWTFHRTEPFKAGGGGGHGHKLRYTIRYIPSSARAASSGGMLHGSVAPGDVFRGAHYPQVWPRAVEEEVRDIARGLEEDSMSLSRPKLVAALLLKFAKEKLSALFP